MDQNFSKETEEMLIYLENKYEEKFIAERLVLDDGVSAVPNKAYVCPEGKEYDYFAVKMEAGDEDTEYTFSDGYGFIFAEQAVLSDYKNWIKKSFQNAKLTIRIGNELETTRELHEKGVSFEEFVAKELPFTIDINIFLIEDKFNDTDKAMKQLSGALADMPGRRAYCDCKVAFIKADKFDGIDEMEYKGASINQLKEIDGITAYSSCGVSGQKRQDEIHSELSNNFADDFDFDLDAYVNPGKDGEIDG